MFGMLYLQKQLLSVVEECHQMLQLHRLLKYIFTHFIFHTVNVVYLVYLIFPSSHVQEAVQVKGLRDDTTCIVVDIQPPEKNDPPKIPPKKQGKRGIKSMFRKKPSESTSHPGKEEHTEPDVVEEMFEEGSALLSERSEGFHI